MPTPDREIRVRIVAKDDTGPGTRSARKGILESINDLKKIAGPRGPLKDIAELAVGGGAVAGISFIGRILQDGTERAIELKEQFKAGKLTAGQLAEELAKQIPIYGKIVAAGRNIRELITGDEAALKAANAEAEKTVAITDRITAGFRRSREAIFELKQQFRAIQLEGAAPGPGKDAALGISRLFDKLGKVNAGARELIDPILNPKGGPSLDALRKSVRELQKQRDAVNIPAPMIATVGGVLTPAKKVVSNQSKIDAAKAVRDSLSNELGMVEREIQARIAAAKPLQDQATANLKETLKTQAKLWAQAGKESATKFWKELQKTDKENQEKYGKMAAENVAENVRESLNVRLRALDKAASDRRESFEQQLNAAERAATEDVARLRITRTPSSGLAEAQISGSLTGVSESSKRRAAEDPVFKEAQKQTEAQESLLESLVTIQRLIENPIPL